MRFFCASPSLEKLSEGGAVLPTRPERGLLMDAWTQVRLGMDDLARVAEGADRARFSVGVLPADCSVLYRTAMIVLGPWSIPVPVTMLELGLVVPVLESDPDWFDYDPVFGGPMYAPSRMAEEPYGSDTTDIVEPDPLGGFFPAARIGAGGPPHDVPLYFEIATPGGHISDITTFDCELWLKTATMRSAVPWDWPTILPK